MNILQVTPGTGTFHCGSCLRDNLLVHELRRLGLKVTLAPMYLPFVVDDAPADRTAPVFFGGINVYLQQKSAFFRHTPRWLDRCLDGRALLKFAARHSHMTSPRAHGELALSMLRGHAGRQAKELDRLLAYACAQQPPIDIVMLSNALLTGLVPALREALRVPVVVALQGEDVFLDRLPQPHRAQAWELVRQHAREVAAFIAPSRWYAREMTQRLQVDAARVRVVPNGIDLSGYPDAHEPPAPPTVGYLARLCPDKGLHILVRAFIALARVGRVPEARLLLVGAMTPGDRSYVAQQMALLRQAGLAERVELAVNVDRSRKIALLQRMSALSVPVTYGEAFGLYVIEGWAAGVPVVLPRVGALPELVEDGCGGLLHAAEDAEDLAAQLLRVLTDSALAQRLGDAGRAAVRQRYHAAAMTQGVLRVLQQVQAAD